MFAGLSNPLAEFGFIVAATLGATAGTSDLTDGVFRHLVITGRSRLALYLARIPAGLSIILPLVTLAFTMVCLVTSYEGTPQPASISVNGYSVPAHFDQAQLESWLLQHPQLAAEAFGPGSGTAGIADPAGPAGTGGFRATIGRDIGTINGAYTADENGELNPPVNEVQNRIQSRTLVLPPSALWVRWCTSHADTGWSQPPGCFRNPHRRPEQASWKTCSPPSMTGADAAWWRSAV